MELSKLEKKSLDWIQIDRKASLIKEEEDGLCYEGECFLTNEKTFGSNSSSSAEEVKAS